MKVLLFANTDWYLYNFRLSLARRLQDEGHDVLLVSPPGGYGDRLRQMDLRWLPAPMQRRSLDPLRELWLLLWLRRVIRAERTDLVHGFTIKCAVYGSLAARLAGGRTHPVSRVGAVAGMGYVFISSDLRARILRPLIRALMRLAFNGKHCRLILQNRDDADFFLRESLVEPTRLRVIPGSGVDCTRFSPRLGPPGGVEGSVMRVLLPARLLWDKGVMEFVEAARLLRAQAHPIEFLLAGEPDPGNPAAVPIEQVRAWHDEGVLKWFGHVEDMPALLKTVDVVAIPSYREGLPKGLIEAAASAVALVTTDVPGCREVVTHEIDGLLVSVRDASGLANAILRLHQDPVLRRRLGAAAREKALSKFDERIVIQQTLDVYQELLGEAA